MTLSVDDLIRHGAMVRVAADGTVCDRCHANSATWRRTFAFVCEACQEELVSGDSGFVCLSRGTRELEWRDAVEEAHARAPVDALGSLAQQIDERRDARGLRVVGAGASS